VQSGSKRKVAAVVTEFTYRSHAHVILENFLVPYLFNGEVIDPPCEIVSLYLDQTPEREMGHAVASEFRIPIFPTIAQALTSGGDTLAVDAVLSIGEHGKYPKNEKGQHEYPRKRFFDEIVAVFKASGRSVPVFNDKHLSYRWDWAKEMVDTAQSMGFPLMAGSSVPLAQRRPPLELPKEPIIKRAVSVHGGGVESYDFHCLEVLQSIVESRKGGESGIASVTFLERDALWPALESEGGWGKKLADAAMRAELGPDTPSARALVMDRLDGKAHGIKLRYSDGLEAFALKLGDSSTRWTFACDVEGESVPRATSYYVGPWQNRNLFRALSHAIQLHFTQKRAPYPVERTLLVSGVLDFAMDSRFRKGVTVNTPALANLSYAPVDFRHCREMGKTWDLITPETPQPEGIDRATIKLKK
jgi:hypothetical protein